MSVDEFLGDVWDGAGVKIIRCVCFLETLEETRGIYSLLECER